MTGILHSSHQTICQCSDWRVALPLGPEQVWLKCILSSVLQRLKILPVNHGGYFVLLSGNLHLVRAPDAVDPKLVKSFLGCRELGLCSVEGGAVNPAASSWCIWWLKVWRSGIGFLLLIVLGICCSQLNRLLDWWNETYLVLLFSYHLHQNFCVHLPLFSSAML